MASTKDHDIDFAALANIDPDVVEKIRAGLQKVRDENDYLKTEIRAMERANETLQEAYSDVSAKMLAYRELLWFRDGGTQGRVGGWRRALRLFWAYARNQYSKPAR